MDEGALQNIGLALEPKIDLAQPLNLGQGRAQFLLLGPDLGLGLVLGKKTSTGLVSSMVLVQSLVLCGQLGERLIRVCQEPSNSLQK